jgi:hypothetical protein
VYSFSISHAAADMLWEDLKLGSRPYPFEFPHLGQTFDERKRIKDAVYRDLESRGLANRGRVSAEVEEALILLIRSDFGINAIAMLDAKSEKPLLARGGAAGETAVLAVLDDRMMKVDLIRSTALVRSVVDLLPAQRPGPGQSITLSAPASAPTPRVQDDFDNATFTRAVASNSPAATQMRGAEAIFERPRLRLGQFGLSVRGRHGREFRSPQLAWFDTDAGRYQMQSRRGQDGTNWLTVAPSDNARLAAQLGQELNSMRAG